MSSRLNPYLNFNGSARQALEFYRSVFGGTLNINTFADFGGQDSPDADKVMHGQLETDAGYTVMAADHASNMGEYHPPSGFGISLSGDDGDLRGYWEKLSDSGNTTMPMQKQAWGDEFGIAAQPARAGRSREICAWSISAEPAPTARPSRRSDGTPTGEGITFNGAAWPVPTAQVAADLGGCPVGVRSPRRPSRSGCYVHGCPGG